jgi:putative endonuclease
VSAFFVYLLRCADGTLYTGYTGNLDARVALHDAGKGAAYTRSRRPVRLVHHELFATKSEAMRREALIKTWSKAEKEALIVVDS